ncbi:TetR/AcrR family transcriptional regulator [Spirillospora sp. CA-142024]|uniref:TetR/AcrR family transcriptional regulator n=1 Tax=Spirillospora sp. CA-142024 TaxID=3240036 RepID=UPI003D8E8E1D
MEDAAEPDRIIGMATRLFANLGYDGMSLGMIADAFGIPVSTVTTAAGDKRRLYLTVMQRAFEAEREALQSAMDTCPPGRACVHHILDAYIDFHVGHPYVRALWAHRWVSDAADIPDLENHYPRLLFRLVGSRIKDEVPPGVNTYYLLGMMVWCVHGFLGSGVLAADQGMLPADEPKVLAEFRSQMHLMFEGMLTARQ